MAWTPTWLFILCLIYFFVVVQRATPERALILKSALSIYEQLSGQKVSLAKSAIFFQKHVRWGDGDGLADMLGILQSYWDCKYLGLPYLVGKSKKI